MSTARLRHTKGFTLIEMLVVLSIIVAGSSISVFFLKQNEPNIKLYSESRALRLALQRARELSLTTQIDHGVQFFELNDLYTLVRFDNSGVTVLETTSLGSPVTYQSVSAFTENSARFNRSGGSVESGTVVLQNDYGSIKTITISPSGYVRVE